MIFGRGRETTLPIQLVIGKPPTEEQQRTSEDYIASLEEQLATVHDVARKSLKAKNPPSETSLWFQAKKHSLKAGELVWVHDPVRKIGVCTKLTSPWKGPAIVVKRIDDVNYKIKRGKAKAGLVYHIDHLVPYKGRNMPFWIEQQKVLLEGTLEEQYESFKRQIRSAMMVRDTSVDRYITIVNENGI